MRGLMQEWPLLVHTFIDHAKIHHGEREIVTRKVEGDIHELVIHSCSKVSPDFDLLKPFLKDFEF